MKRTDESTLARDLITADDPLSGLPGRWGEFDKLRQVPKSRTYALFDDEGCYVRGRYHWSVQGPASDIAHGSLSLMECLVAVIRIRRG